MLISYKQMQNDQNDQWIAHRRAGIDGGDPYEVAVRELQPHRGVEQRHDLLRDGIHDLVRDADLR